MTTVATLLRRARALVLGLLVLVVALAVAPAAQAHDMLIGSDPAEGAVLEEAPETIVLTFNNPPLEVGSAISVVDSAGTTVAEGEGTVDGTDVVLQLAEALPAGELEVRWRVASSDGHPIEGTIPFTLDAPAEPEQPTTEAPATPEATTPAAAAPEATEATDPATEAADAEPADDAGGMPTWLKVAIGVAALGAVVGLVVLVAKRLREDRP